MLKQNLKPKEPIVNGNKINCLKVEKLSIRFIDSINFTLCPLRAFPSTFGVEGKKGHFPHYFNVKANQDNIGPYPDKKYYGYNTFIKKNKEDFDK